MKDAAQQLIDTLNATGGIFLADHGLYAPVGDEEWTDLAEAYLTACEEKDVEPFIVTDTFKL